MFLDDLLERNRAYAGGRKSEPLPPAEAISLAVVGCFDPRLDAMLRPALGLGEGEGFMLRTAGAVVTPASLRSLTLAVYLFEVERVLVVGHSSCKMAHFPTDAFIDAFRSRGVRRQAFGATDLRTWTGAIANPRQGVLSSIAAISEAPFLPADLTLAGAVLDDASGKLEVVFRPGDALPRSGLLPEAGSPPAIDSPPPPPPAAQGPPATPTPRPDTLPTTDNPAGATATDDSPEPLATVGSLLESLARSHRLRGELPRLRVALERESKPIRQLILLQRFVKNAAAESPEIRTAFEQLKGGAVGRVDPQAITELVQPLLGGRRRRRKQR